MRNRMYGGVRGRKMKVGGKLLHFPPTRLMSSNKPQFILYFEHLFVTFRQVEKVFSFENAQINLAFCSLIRTFAASTN